MMDTEYRGGRILLLGLTELSTRGYTDPTPHANMIFTVLLVLLITRTAIVTGLAVPGLRSPPTALASATTSARTHEHFGNKFCNAACASVVANVTSSTRLSKRLNSGQVAFVLGGTAIGAGVLIIILLFVAIYAVRRRLLRLEKLGSSQLRTSEKKDKEKTKANSIDNRCKYEQPTQQDDSCIWGPPSPPTQTPSTAWQNKETIATLSNPPAPRAAAPSRPTRPDANQPMTHAAAVSGLVGSNIRLPQPAALPPPRNPNRDRKQNQTAGRQLAEGQTMRQTPKSLPPLMTQLPTSPSQVSAFFGPPRSGSTSRPRHQHRLSVSSQTATLADDSRWSMSTLGMELLSDTMKSPAPARYSYTVSPETPVSGGSSGHGELARRRSGNNKGGRGRGAGGGGGAAAAATAGVQSPWRADCEEQLVGPGTRWKSVWTIYEDDDERPQSYRSEKK